MTVFYRRTCPTLTGPPTTNRSRRPCGAAARGIRRSNRQRLVPPAWTASAVLDVRTLRITTRSPISAGACWLSCPALLDVVERPVPGQPLPLDQRRTPPSVQPDASHRVVMASGTLGSSVGTACSVARTYRLLGGQGVVGAEIGPRRPPSDACGARTLSTISLAGPAPPGDLSGQLLPVSSLSASWRRNSWHFAARRESSSITCLKNSATSL
jgi:hypothetical protein